MILSKNRTKTAFKSVETPIFAKNLDKSHRIVYNTNILLLFGGCNHEKS